MNLSKYRQKSNGLYILGKKDFDAIAEDVLMEKMPYVFNYPQPTPIEYLAEELLYLDVKYDSISPDGEILGMIAFDDTQYVPMGYEGLVEPRELTAGTIMIDMSLIGHECRPRRRFTISHEVAHWLTQRSYHDPTNRCYNMRKNNSYVACRTENIESYKKDFRNRSDDDWAEWQADGVGAALLMPKQTFSREVEDLLFHHHIYSNCLVPGKDDNCARKIIFEVAERFDVSYRATQIRMIQLGYISDKKRMTA